LSVKRITNASSFDVLALPISGNPSSTSRSCSFPFCLDHRNSLSSFSGVDGCFHAS
jgi:hypothetical protein